MNNKICYYTPDPDENYVSFYVDYLLIATIPITSASLVRSIGATDGKLHIATQDEINQYNTGLRGN